MRLRGSEGQGDHRTQACRSTMGSSGCSCRHCSAQQWEGTLGTAQKLVVLSEEEEAPTARASGTHSRATKEAD